MDPLSMNDRPLRVLMISSEVESLARTGGLGDVVAALSRALAEAGKEVLVVTPLYGVTRLPPDIQRWPAPTPIRFGWGPHDVEHAGVVELETTTFPSGGTLRTCLIDSPRLFGRAGIYGENGGVFEDNPLRFAVMSRGALEISARAWETGPDVLHAHDWHAAFAIVYAKLVMGPRWAKTPAVFTIHNLAFQGVLDEEDLDLLHLPREAYKPEVLLHDQRVNLMKGATALADRVTTVSPTYAREILTPQGGFGLDAHLRAHEDRLSGIVNGIDTALFDPSTDPHLAHRFDATSLVQGRAACKRALAEEVGLEPGDGPLFGAVTRLTWQKGIDLLLGALDAIVAEGGRVLIVGQGDHDLEQRLTTAAARFPGKVAVRIAFDPPLSRRVYSASDFFFVPSRFEPCGLTQLYAMRYGALPIVTDVGGLHDTVAPAHGDRGTGFVMPAPSVVALETACRHAFALYRDREAMVRVQVRAMAEDHSWRGPAQAYVDLYEQARATE